jgi:uncharacterized RDD family membrane protein YckC
LKPEAGGSTQIQRARAGIVSRGVAAIVDLGVTLVLLVGIYLGASAVRFIVRPARFRFPQPAPGVSGSVWIVLATIYLAVGWATTGRTVGDQLMGLRVVDRHGALLRLGVAFLRAVLCVMFPVGLLWCVVSRRNASVQDLLVPSSVVYDWRPVPSLGSARSKDALGARVDVAAAVADEADDRHAESLPRLDGE